jgi:flagellar hook-associated protein 3 FlgL
VSDLESVDMGEAITRLNQNQVALQAALQVASQLNRLSLLNFLS